MGNEFSHAAGRLRGRIGEPQVTVTPSAVMGFVAVADDGNGNAISLWGRTELDARMRVLALWHGLTE